MKLQIRESFKKLDINFLITDYVGDVVNLLVNKPKPYRITYIKYDDLYIIADAEKFVHYDMTDKAIELGYLPKSKEFMSRCNMDLEEFDSYYTDNLIFLTDADLTNFGSYSDIYATTEFGYEYPITTGSLFTKSKYSKNYLKIAVPDLYDKLQKYAIEQPRIFIYDDNGWNI